VSYCINPLCPHRQNPDEVENCLSCGTSLLINNRIRLIKPLKALTDNPYNYFDVFEVDDVGTRWYPVREQRVMKVLKWNTPKLIELIERESLTLQLIRHPKIPRSTLEDYFTVVPNDSLLTLHCLVMNKFEGQNLEQWIEFNGRISQSLALEWLKQLVEILDTVHRSNFFHRDIKPSNIVLQPDGQLALVDFGTARRVTDTYLAKVSGSGGTSTGRGGVYEITAVVTPRYTPLEQVNGQAVPQSDFYALGRTFVHLVTGTSLMRLPTDKNTGNLIWRKKAEQIDKPFADFIEELMAPLPGQRPQTTRVILQRLERLPLKSKLHRVITSKSFQIGAGIFGALSFFGLFYVSLPFIANYYLEQGKKSQQENRFADAQNHFKEAIKYNSNLTDSISQFYFEQADRRGNTLETSRKYYELAIKLNPKYEDAYTNLALICQEMSDNSCIKSSYEALFSLNPKSWLGHYTLGSFYDDRTEYGLAESQYKLAIKNNSQAVAAINNLSRLKNITGDYNTAVYLALDGLQKTKDPESQATLYKNPGWAKLGQKKYSEAKEYLEKATDLDSKRTDAYCLLAQVHEALGEINHARISWEVCLVAESNQLEVQQWRKQVLKRLLGDIAPGSSP
jgi:serine/threonine protein kinase